MLCLMFECEERGVLCTAGMPWTNEQIAAAITGEHSLVLACIDELLAAGVARRVKTSTAIFSVRMVRDENIRRARQSAGRLGGIAKQMRGTGEAKGLAKPKHAPEDEDEDEGKNQGVGVQGAGEGAPRPRDPVHSALCEAFGQPPPDASGFVDDQTLAALQAFLGHGRVGSRELDVVGLLVRDYTAETVRRGFDIAREQGVRTLAYAAAVIRNGAQRAMPVAQSSEEIDFQEALRDR